MNRVRTQHVIVCSAWMAIGCVVLFAVWAVSRPLYIQYRLKTCLRIVREDERREVFEKAKQELQKIGRPAIPHLVELLKDRSCDNRWRAAACLQGMGGTAIDAVPFLLGALDDPQRETRQSACRALGSIGSREAIPGLLREVHGLGAIGAAEKALRELVPEAVAEAEGAVYMNRSSSEYEAIRQAWEEMAA